MNPLACVPPSASRLTVQPRACLTLRFPDSDCALCIQACPLRALVMTANGPQLHDECAGCGQCAAACPTSAITLAGFGLPERLAAVEGAAEIGVDCWRVSPHDSPPDAWRVPCLGGLDTGALLSLIDHAGGRPVRFLDRGFCEGCPVGGGLRAIGERLAEVCDWLLAAGMPAAALPTVSFVPAKRPPAPTIPPDEAEIRLPRRDFFHRLASGLARTVASPREEESSALGLRERALPSARIRAMHALARIARRQSGSLPTKALPQLSAGGCAGHGVCARLCPVGALTFEAAEHGATLVFHPARCIGCGQCAAHCPERALRFAPVGGAAASETLARLTARRCVVCGGALYDSGDAACPVCRKDRQVERGVAALFAPRN